MDARTPLFLNGFDFEKTLKDYEYTRIIERQILQVVESSDFEEMDSAAILKYLSGKMQLVSFKDYLKRYIYETAGFTEPFNDISDQTYAQIINESFTEASAPHSFEPVSTRWSVVINGWLTHDRVRRPTVFLLGFGLRMTDKDVSWFLTKVLKDQDFDFSDPVETVYWFCYRNSLKYAEAHSILNQKHDSTAKSCKPIRNADEAVSAGLDKRQNLERYLAWLYHNGGSSDREDLSRQHFKDLLQRTKEIIAGFFQSDENEKSGGKIWTPDDITPADIERVVCCGIPFNHSGNLKKASLSLLNRHFNNYRLSRQRIDAVLSGKYPADCYDLITLLFFIYSQKTDLKPDDRCRAFLDETNIILSACGMMKIHPVNPYESFVLMCLLADEPLATYAEVLEMSYAEA